MLKPPIEPMEAEPVERIPEGSDWQYEPKWDGFRSLLFRHGDKVFLQSKGQQPLARYFPEITSAAKTINAKWWVLDGELALPIGSSFSFDHLLRGFIRQRHGLQSWPKKRRQFTSPSIC